MDCGVDQNRNELESWFINLWNHFVIPYLMGAIMAGIEVSLGKMADTVAMQHIPCGYEYH